MALPPPVRISDTRRLISPADDAIDASQLPQPDEPPEDAAEDWKPPATWWTRYQAAQELDTDKLPLKAEPVWFEVRALSPREFSLAQALVRGGAGDVGDREIALLRGTAFLGYCLRFGLVSMDGRKSVDVDGEPIRRGRAHGVRIWPESLLDAFDDTTVVWLGLAIQALSTLPTSGAGTSGSSPGARSGTRRASRKTASGKSGSSAPARARRKRGG